MSAAAGPGGRQRLLLYGALGLLTAAVVGVGVYFGLRSPGSAGALPPAATSTLPAVIVQATPTPLPSATPPPAVGAPTFEVFEARDPFDQLVTEDEAADGTGGTGLPTGTGTGSGTGTGTGSGTGAPATTAPPRTLPSPTATAAPPSAPTTAPTTAPTARPTPPASEEVDGATIELVDTFVDGAGNERVLVTVNRAGYEAGEGDVFAGDTGRVLTIDAPCATLEYRGNRLNLCEGETDRK